MLEAPDGPTWVGLTEDVLDAGAVGAWAVLPSCGAVVTFAGTARDHAEGRPDVTALEYEAYEDQVLPRFTALVAEARRRWPDLGRMAVLHRIGPVALAEASVVVAAGAPHRGTALGGVSWGLDARAVRAVPTDRARPETLTGDQTL